MISNEKMLFTAGAVRERIFKQVDFCEAATILVFGRQKFDQTFGEKIRVISTDSLNPVLYVFDALRVLWRVRKERFDVVTTQDPVETGLVGWFATRIFKAALAIQDHGYYFHGDYFRKESFLNRFRYWFARWLVKRADAVRVVSERTEKALVDLGVAKDRIVRFPLTLNSTQYAVRSTEYDGERAEDGIREDGPSYSALRTPYFLIACRFVAIKRLDLAIHAFSLVAEKHPDVKLKVVGRGPLEGFVRDKISEFNLADRVEIIPWTNDLKGLYKGTIATLITSDREGFGMTAVESLMAGTPVVMTDVGCAGEVVKDGVNGYVVPVGDVDGLADGMEKVLKNRDNLTSILEAAHKQGSNRGMDDLVRLAIENKSTVGYNTKESI